ncbi:hypothetical protein, partial [uncultured Tenacibaculum sp.]|uniref:hypothetical protein n=1 Tax=uncultured Tenacibaculum sp. TaxID=174713 RepID=UPI00262AC226
TITPTPAGTYTYELLDSAGASVATNSTGVFNGQADGSYTVEVNYGSGCTTDIAVVVLDNQEFTANAVGSAVSCNGDTDGEITITATNFGASFEYN